eukprot:TRINITY_DN205_c0_g1_i1.p1 TRINITY_DN205_c0_g1~~TRINITY_DN205_c0_g1_i1.p1  ORF type:complete len:441 (+),score=106.52 TRINITY_DN205_c0_g1_i1:175-1497(+)
MSDIANDLLTSGTTPSTTTPYPIQFSPTSGRSSSPILPEQKMPWEENEEIEKDKTNLPPRAVSTSSGSDLSSIFSGTSSGPKISVTVPSPTSLSASQPSNPTPPNSGAFFTQNPTFGRSSLSTPTVPDKSNFIAAGVIDSSPTPPNSGAVTFGGQTAPNSGAVGFVHPTAPNSGAVNYVAPTPPNSSAFGVSLSNSGSARDQPISDGGNEPRTPFNTSNPKVANLSYSDNHPSGQSIDNWEKPSNLSSSASQSNPDEGQANFANVLATNLNNLGSITKIDRKPAPYSPSGSSDSSPVSASPPSRSPPASFGVHDAIKSDVDEDDDDENDFSIWMEDVISEQKRYVKNIMKPVEKIYEQNMGLKKQIESLTQRLTAEESRNRQMSEKISHQDKQIEHLLERLDNLEKREDRNFRAQAYEGQKSSSSSNLTSNVMKIFKGSQ